MSKILNLDKKETRIKIESKTIILKEAVNSKRRAYINKINDINITLQNLASSIFPAIQKMNPEGMLELKDEDIQKIQESTHNIEIEGIKLDKELFELILDAQFEESWFDSLSFPQMKGIIEQFHELNEIDIKKGVSIVPIIIEMVSREV